MIYVCVLDPSLSGFLCHMNICCDHAAEHEILFEYSKTFSVLFHLQTAAYHTSCCLSEKHEVC